MLRLTLELIPQGNEKLKTTIGTLEIANDRTGTSEFGNYEFNMDYPLQLTDGVLAAAAANNQIRCHGYMKHFQRSAGYWHTVKKVLGLIETDLEKIKNK